MKDIIKNMKEKCYCVVYEELKKMNYDYTLQNFAHDFKKVDSATKYCYLLYMIARQDSPKLRILICDALMFTDTFFDDTWTVIHWHLKQALNMEPDNIDILLWIIEILYGSPDSLFSEQEMYDFACTVILKSPEDKRAKEIIEDYNKKHEEHMK